MRGNFGQKKTAFTAFLTLGEGIRFLTAIAYRRGMHKSDMCAPLERGLAQKSTALLVRRLRRQYRYGIIGRVPGHNALQWNIFRRVFI